MSSQILAVYQALYDVEERGRRLDAVSRLALRRRESVPLMQRLEQLLQSDEASADRHDLDVWAYLRDVLERLASGETDLESLLPDV